MIHLRRRYRNVRAVYRTTTLRKRPLLLEAIYDVFQAISSWKLHIQWEELLYNCQACFVNNYADCISGYSKMMGNASVLRCCCQNPECDGYPVFNCYGPSHSSILFLDDWPQLVQRYVNVALLILKFSIQS